MFVEQTIKIKTFNTVKNRGFLKWFKYGILCSFPYCCKLSVKYCTHLLTTPSHLPQHTRQCHTNPFVV